jgi:hypothetical protein
MCYRIQRASACVDKSDRLPRIAWCAGVFLDVNNPASAWDV